MWGGRRGEGGGGLEGGGEGGRGVGGEGEEGTERDRGGKIFSQFMYR